MNNIELTSLIKCEECNQIYEDPVILPCHMTIFSKHRTKTKIYQCKNCNQDHIRPENGYPSDKKALNQIKIINDNHLLVTNQVNELQNECNLNAGNKTSMLNKTMREIRNNIAIWMKSLEVPDFTKYSHWNTIGKEAEQELERMKHLIKQCQNDLLLKKEYKFIQGNNFGLLKVNNIDINNSEGVVRLQVDNFTSFSQKQEILRSKDCCIIRNIFWKISAGIYETKEQGPFLNFFVYPDDEQSISKENPVKIYATCRIVQHYTQFKSKCRLERSFEYKYERITSYGFATFISLKDILDETNGIYNRDEDSVQLEATVKII